MFDSHCHLAFDAFAGRLDEVVAAARDAGVRGMITVATTTANVEPNRAIAGRFDNVWYSAGVHPLHSDEPYDFTRLREVIDDPKCVAWGELGLDNHYDKPPRKVQDRVLNDQLAYLEGLKSEGFRRKPIICHCRKAFDDLIPVLKETTFDPSRFVFHCFTGTPDDARKVLDFGAWISFTGVVTFRNAKEVAEAAKIVPRDRIMVETDAPFLAPEPVRKAWPNEPKFVPHIGRFLAEIRGEDAGAFEDVLDENTARFFGIEFD